MKSRGPDIRVPVRYRIRLWLEAKGKNQNWLAGKVGIKAAHMSQILSGARGPSLRVATRLEALTGGEIKATDFVDGGRL